MDLLEIARHDSVNHGQLVEFKPIRKANYHLPECELPTTLNGHNKPILSKVYAFILLCQRKRFADGATIMPIATTNKRFMSITGSQRNCSNLITYMIKLGLLTVEDEHFQFNANNEEFNKSKTYVYYVDNERKIVEYCRSNHITYTRVQNYINYIDIHTVIESYQFTTFDTSKVCFSSKLHLTKPANMSVSEFEAALTDILYQRYPNLKHYQQLADYINDKYYHDDLARQIVFKPHFAWAKGNKYIRKIGIRATNGLVNAKTNNITGYEDDSILMKKDVLDEYGLNLEYDVKSSVPRITYFMNTGIWKKDGDFYHDIYKKLYDSDDNFTPETRALIKKLHMRGYFDSVATIGVHTRRAYNISDKSIDDEMKRFKVAVEDAEGGNTLDSEVFYHESCIYMDVLKELLDRGFDVWEVYDSWYASKAGCTQEEYTEIVEEVIENVVKNYDKEDVVVADNTSTYIHNKYIHNNITDNLCIHTVIESCQFDTSDLANQALLL